MGKIEKIKLHNFKSFKNISLPFADGYTVIVGPNGSGKCLSPEVEVVLADGSKTAIGKLVEGQLKKAKDIKNMDDGFYTAENSDDLKILSLNPETLKIERKKVAAFVKRKAPEKMLKIKTKAGKEIVTTPYHPLFRLKDGQLVSPKAEELRVGAKIASPRLLLCEPIETEIDFASYFKPEDNIYVPHSAQLRDYVRSFSEKYGRKWKRELSKTASIPVNAIEGLMDGQSINIAYLNSIIESNGSRSKKYGLIRSFKAKNQNIEHEPIKEVTPELSRFLGYMISEGTNNLAGQLRFVNSDEEVVDDFSNACQTSLDVKPGVFNYKQNAADAIIFSQPLCRTMQRLFDFGKERAATKRAPDLVIKSNDGVTSSFLSALFTGDGYVNAKTGYIEYATASRQLAKDVQFLLLKLGVISLIKEKRKAATNTKLKTKRTYYSVYIYGYENIRKFADSVGLIGEKQGRLKLLSAKNVKQNPNLDLIPESNGMFKNLVKESGISVKSNRKRYPSLASYYENRCEMSRQELSRLLKFLNAPDSQNYKQLEKLANSEVYWDEITEIKEIKPESEWVYDLCVEKNHNFVAENIFVHNSNIIDGVCFAIGTTSMKNLRANRLSDLVNSKSSEPVAEVTLNLRDGVGEQHAVSRTIDKTGASVFRMDDRRTTKFQVEELLSSMNIHPDGHNIIMQGDVERFVKMTPQQRRGLIDEVSGIAEYEAKKDEALTEISKVEEKIKEASTIMNVNHGYLKVLEKEKI
ncbi:MAG: LAGLIDADG family homing endonuclease, partial [Candidatus Micrarchaeota archaeon]